MRILIIFIIFFSFTYAIPWDDSPDDYDPCNQDIIHWSVDRFNPYEDTVIVTDPYNDK